jgi:hypothetical protein
MNRSILIVICDFLLISLLAFSTIDQEALEGDMANRRVKLDLSMNSGESRQDLASVMKLALDDERQARDQLLGELERNRGVIGQQQAAIEERQRQLAERERQFRTVQQTVQTNELRARQLAQEKSALEERIQSAQSSLQNLQKAVSASGNEALVSRELAAVTRDELRRERERTAALQEQLGQLEKSNQLVEVEKRRLASELLVVEAEKRAAADQAVRMQDEVKVVREEKERLTQHAEKLADGVKTLAGKSGDLAREIRENRPLTANSLFSEFVTNRVDARFYAFRPGMLGFDHLRKRETELILTSDGTNHYALCHVDETAVSLSNPASDWLSLTGAMVRNVAQVPIRSLSFALMDPRVVLIPLTAAQAGELGCKVYRIAAEPFKFQEAVLVGAREGYYGECKFEIDLAAPQYVKMDRSVLRGLFGKFNPSRGDLVLSKTGELLGIMVNNTYCLRLYNFSTVASLEFGQDVREQHTGELLSRLHLLVSQLPAKLQ